MVTAGFGIGVVVDPIAEVAAKFSEIVIPMRTQAQGIAYEAPMMAPVARSWMFLFVTSYSILLCPKLLSLLIISTIYLSNRDDRGFR